MGLKIQEFRSTSMSLLDVDSVAGRIKGLAQQEAWSVHVQLPSYHVFVLAIKKRVARHGGGRAR